MLKCFLIFGISQKDKHHLPYQVLAEDNLKEESDFQLLLSIFHVQKNPKCYHKKSNSAFNMRMQIYK